MDAVLCSNNGNVLAGWWLRGGTRTPFAFCSILSIPQVSSELHNAEEECIAYRSAMFAGIHFFELSKQRAVVK